jgi:cysteine desulfurase/selenocysteine lyase
VTSGTAPAPSLRDVRGEFPVLSREIDGRLPAYLDSAATSLTPLPVIDAMDHYYREVGASIHRGVYPLAVEATDAFEGAREKIARWLGSTIEETIFTANATASWTGGDTIWAVAR